MLNFLYCSKLTFRIGKEISEKSNRVIVIIGKTLETMKKHVATFPTDEEILTKYYEQKEWENYKVKIGIKLDLVDFL